MLIFVVDFKVLFNKMYKAMSKVDYEEAYSFLSLNLNYTGPSVSRYFEI